MLPKKRDNIYPLTEENITAILNFYFDIPHGNIDWLYNQKELSINQIEWIAKSVSEHIDFLQSNIESKWFTVTHLMLKGRDAFFNDKKNWLGNSDDKAITEKLKELVLNSI
ncbi:hypothetical protein [Arenibacter lacus]|uniref:hypothetical protein n=1 Tax=Arenibacter lacus TaxID=2608629 RepID=UPI00123CD801|nr:hypothetical protein [Arenibacter lacus]